MSRVIVFDKEMSGLRRVLYEAEKLAESEDGRWVKVKKDGWFGREDWLPRDGLMMMVEDVKEVK